MSGTNATVERRLAEWCRRVGLDAPPPLSPRGLETAQRAQRMAIGFESLDVTLKRTIAIDSDSVFAKLVRGRRGGYCFEQNRLFADMLALAGFPCRPLMARVWLGLQPGEVPPRTHVLLLVTLGDEAWIADAGFGAAYVPAMPLVDGAETMSAEGTRHRLRRIGARGEAKGEWRLERDTGCGEWQALHSFDLGEVAPVDLEQANHWTNTRPGTRFTNNVLVSIVLEDGFAALTGRRLTLHRSGHSETTEIAAREDYRKLLADRFRIEVSEEEVAALHLF